VPIPIKVSYVRIQPGVVGEGRGDRETDSSMTGSPPAARNGARETNAVTSRLILLHIERANGTAAVAEVLARAGLSGRRDELMDESNWFSYAEKIALFEAAAEVLDDPDVMLRVGDVALDLNVGAGLKLALRALGSPRLVYQNIVRANSKFSGSHAMELLDLGGDHAVIRYRDLSSARRYHPLDCQYNRAMLGCVPGLFGLAPARVDHHICGCEGAEACVYVLRWDDAGNEVRSWLTAAAAGAVAIAGTAILAPALLPLGVGVAGTAGTLAAARSARRRSARCRQLEHEVKEQSGVAERLNASLQELVSALRLEEVLAKVTRNAKAAVESKEFALLIDEDGVPGCRSSTDLSPGVTGRLERWAIQAADALRGPVEVEDVSLVPVLAPLGARDDARFGSLSAVPLTFRGEHLGVLIALASQPHSFLPRDSDLIHSYAAQAAVAIANARLYEAQEQLASRDGLTGLLNHREFHEALGREIERSARYAGRFGLVIFDLDRFKAVNDAQGHAEGDRVLRGVASAIAGACRSSDLAFRIGGDEFALVLPEAGHAAAEVAADRVRAAIEAMDRSIDVSFGVAVWPHDGADKEELLATADARLYRMKREHADESTGLRHREQLGSAADADGDLAPEDFPT
jgi:diguanylate cyclase (GGDEF)-like protein